MASAGFSKVFILDKYFSELQKFWETQKKLQEIKADSSNEKVHLEKRLQSLSSELVSLRNHIHVTQEKDNSCNKREKVLKHLNSFVQNKLTSSEGFSLEWKPDQRPKLQQSKEKGLRVRSSSRLCKQLTSESNLQVTEEKLQDELLNCIPSSSTKEMSHCLIPNLFLTKCAKSGERYHINSRKTHLSDIEDLIHLPGPLTEDSLIRCLRSKTTIQNQHVWLGPILLLTNPFTALGNALTPGSTYSIQPSPPIKRVVEHALCQQSETGYSQAIVLSGWSGSGKTYTSMLLLRELFFNAGGLNSDAWKYVSASITVIRALGTAKTRANPESSRIGQFLEVQVSDGKVYRTKVHCYFLNQSRVVMTPSWERNYHIFYQLLAGLSKDEKTQFRLGTHSIQTLAYLKSTEKGLNPFEEARRFMDWKYSLSILGIPFSDVIQVLAALLLIGNVRFGNSPCSASTTVVEGEEELCSAAYLLGVSVSSLRQGLTTRTIKTRSHFLKSECHADLSNTRRDALAETLYCRTVTTIVRRANSLKRLLSPSGTLSSDSADSALNQIDIESQRTSTAGTAGSKASVSMTALRTAVKDATSGFVGILDVFGFEDNRRSRLEHLCINLSAETLQHLYNTHIFKRSIEACKEEEIYCENTEYYDNVPCIDLISSLHTGLLSILDTVCLEDGRVEAFIENVQRQHKDSRYLVQMKVSDFPSFSIKHFAGTVRYDVTNFPETNRDRLPDDLVAVFHKHSCSFGFASHLFSSELRVLGGAGRVDPCAKGLSFRILPTSPTEMLNSNQPLSTFTQDFHCRLDSLLKILVHAKPHFIRCIKLNEGEEENLFDRHTVAKQLRAFQVLETLNLMVLGYPRRIRFKAFNNRYKLLLPYREVSALDENTAESSKKIIEAFQSLIKITLNDGCGVEHAGWIVGKKQVFLSERTYQDLENLWFRIRNNAANIIQRSYRGWYFRRQWQAVRQSMQQRSQALAHVTKHFDINGFPELRENKNRKNWKVLPKNLSTYHPMSVLDQNIGSSIGYHANEISQEALPFPSNTMSGVVGKHNFLMSKSETSGNERCLSTNRLNSVLNKSLYNSELVSSLCTRGQPAVRTPLRETAIFNDLTLVRDICALLRVDMENSPPLPSTRFYTVLNTSKYMFPQRRVIKQSLQGVGNIAGYVDSRQNVQVIGPSQYPGHLVVAWKKKTLQLPYEHLELKYHTNKN